MASAEILREQLPESFQHEIVEFERKEKGYCAIIRNNCQCKDDFDRWLKEFKEKSFTDWRVRRDYKVSTRLRFWRDLICQLTNYRHKKKDGPRCKAWNCEASMVFRVKIDSKKTRKTDSYVKLGLCGVVEMNACHSHPTDNGHALSLLRPTQDVRERFIQLFNEGYTGPAAYNYHLTEVELANDDDEAILAASSIVPRKRSVSYWHECWRKQNFGDRDGAAMWNVLEEKIAQYQNQGAIVKVEYKKESVAEKIIINSAGKIVKTNRKPEIVVVLTPIMQRAHKLPSSGEIIFVDSTSSCDDGHHVLTFLFTACAVGAVPIGVVITNGSSEEHYCDGFRVLRDAIGASGFGRKGAPKFFMTDDSEAERSALQAVWPTSKSLLCLFHVPQSIWRWLYDSKNSISHPDRPVLMQEFRNIIYALTKEEAEQKYFEAITSTVGRRYPNWIDYISKRYWERRELWCLVYRKAAALRGNYTNNYVEAAIRLFKDIVLTRARAFNVISLIDFVVTVMETYYRRRIGLFSSSHDTRPYLMLRQVMAKAKEIDENHINDICDGFYGVKSQSGDEFYYVDVQSGVCSCPVGAFGSFCKHQAAIYFHKRIQLPSMPGVTKYTRREMAYLARGDAAKGLEFYQGLDEQCSDGEAHFEAEEQIMRVDSAENPGPSDSIGDNVDALDSESQMDELAEQVADDLKSKLLHFCADANVVAGAAKFLSRLAKIGNASQLATFLHSAGSTIGKFKRAGSKISVQPGSIQRRREGITRGSKRLPGGRRSGIFGQPVKEKRRHNLSLNLKKNQPNGQ